MRRLLACALAATLATVVLLAGGCVKPTPYTSASSKTLVAAASPSAGSPSAAPDTALAAPINDFGFDLLRTREEAADRGPQTVISPLSVHADLAMVADGASSSTLAQMRTTLHLNGIAESVSDAAYANLLAGLNASKDITIAIANSLWADEGFSIAPSFVSVNRRYFGAELRTLDLQSPDAVKEINGWVSSATKGKITQLLDRTPSPETVLYVINATYFKGDWDSPFEKSLTDKQPFHLSSGTASVDTMHQTSEWRYVQTPDYQAIELPYKGNKLSMLVVLPSTTSSLDKLLPSLTAEQFAALRASLAQQQVALSLPKIEVRWDGDLSGDLKALGMPLAFSPDAADFSRMSATHGLFIADVLHKTYLRVDEKGTEAAAVTSTQMATTAAPVNPPVEMTVDRPYLMALVDDDSGAILFLATVRDPR